MHDKKDSITRRRLLVGTVAATLPTIVSARALGLGAKLAASERIGIGVIGTGGMGTADIGPLASKAGTRFVNDPGANRLLGKPMPEPWRL